MDNNTSLMLIDNNGSFEIDDQSHMDIDASHNNSMALVNPIRPTDADTDDGLLPQPGTRRRRKKSMVWEHFTIETTSPGSSKACCKHCRKSFAYITGQKLAGTSHLKRHIQLGICPMSRETPPQLTQVSDTKDASTCPPKKRQRASATLMNVPLDQDRCYSEMAKMIIMHEYPLHMVEHSGFTGFVHALRPQLSMASFHTIHADCVAMYLSEKQKLSAFISEIPGQVNLTVDLWASNQSVGYAFVTGHFIDKDWNLTHRLLNVSVVPSPDSDFALSQPIAACLSDWNLERRLCSLTVGQSGVNKSSIENLRCCLSARNQHVMNGQLLLGNCYARLLSSMAQDVLGAEDFQMPIKKVRDSVKHVKTKDSCSERFDELKTQLQTHSTMVPSKKQKSDGATKASDRNTRSSGSKTKKKTKTNKAESKGIVKKEAEVYEISESSSSGEARRDEPKESNGVVVEDAKMIRFPMNRIRRIMRSDNSAPQIMQDAVFLVNKATELFIEKFSEEAYGSSVKDKKKFIHYKHLSSVASNEERYEFLADCVPEKLKAEVALEEWERVMADVV